MRAKTRKSAIVLLVVGLSLGAWAQVSDEGLLQRADETRFIEADSYTFLLKVIAERPGEDEELIRRESLLKVYNKRFPEGMRIRVEFLEPKSMRGTVYLIIGDEIYFWQPGLLEPIKISGQQKLFGDVSVAEAAGISFQEYQVRSREEEELDGLETLKLELQAKDEAAFPFVTLWLESESLKPVQAVLRALSAEPLKRVGYLRYAMFGKDEYVAEITVEDLLFQGNKTLMQIAEITIEELDSALFDPERLGE